MVSTRGIKQRFAEGERVLCYEPDPTKAKVLYDSKVLGVVETKDNRGRRTLQYKVHFQGWNSSWDRKVDADFVLKDSEENRQLQRDLAEKAQLQLAAYLYRRERKKRNRKENNIESSPKNQNRGSIEDDSSCSTFERNDIDYPSREDHLLLDCDTESYSSSVESLYDEDRVMLKVGEKLKQYLEFDYDMIVKNKRQHILPAQIPAITILENFVKQSAIKLAMYSASQSESVRRRTSQLRPEKREKDLEKFINTISLLKEISDGLRLYLNFTIKDYLLYNEERAQVEYLISEKNHKFVNMSFQRLSSFKDFNKIVSEPIDKSPILESSIHNQYHNKTDNYNQDDSVRRRLRSHKTDDVLINIDFHSIKQNNYFSNIPTKIKEFIEDVLSWQLLPSSTEPEYSMIFGAVHLARLLVKLPEFLSLSTMTDEKLKVLMQHINLFIAYLEEHKEWFDKQNYSAVLH